MPNQIELLAITAASIGFFHTLAGPDHYLPFIMMARARSWSRSKTAWIAFASGLGHVSSSVVLGFIGIALGIAVTNLTSIESVRGDIAAWMLTAFGFVYCIWGVRQAIKKRPHRHLHLHEGGIAHEHPHGHESEHAHIHEEKGDITPWIIFTIFVFGPCEPLIPILMYPAARESISGLILITAVFGAVTIGTMMAIIMLASFGLELLPFRRLEKYTHALAGAAIMACGFAILFLGL